MNIKDIKDELVEHLNKIGEKYSSNLLTLAIYNILKNSNYKEITKNINLAQNKNNISLSIEGETDIVFNENLQLMRDINKNDNNLLFNKDIENFFNSIKKSLSFDNYKEFKDFCISDNVLKNTPNSLINKYASLITEEQDELSYIYFVKALSNFSNSSDEEEIFGFGGTNEDYLFINYCQSIYTGKKLSTHLDAITSINFSGNEDGLLFNSTRIPENMAIKVSNYLSKLFMVSADNMKINDLNLFLDDNDYLKILTQSKTKEDFLNNSFPIFINDMKEKLSMLIDLKIKRNSDIYKITSIVDTFNDVFQKNHPELYIDDINIQEKIEKNVVYSDFNISSIFVPMSLINYNVLKSRLVSEENIAINYFFETIPVLQIHSNFEKLNGHTVISPNNFIDTGNEKLLEKSFDKYFEYCDKNNYIVNPSYKIKSTNNTVLLRAFTNSLKKFPELIVIDFIDRPEYLISVLNQSKLSTKDIKSLIKNGKLKDNNDAEELIKKNPIKIDKKNKNDIM